jgi:hypothetical protein
MSVTMSWRKVLAVPAILSLTVGGVLLGGSSASAAEAGLTVDNPAAGSTVDSRTVTVDGDVFGGSTVIVYEEDGSTVLARTNVSGAFGVATPYSLTLPEYADSEAVGQTIVVGGLYGGSGIPQQSVSFSLPGVAPMSADAGLTITSPVNGSTTDSRSVNVEGSAFGLSNIIVYAEDGTTVLAETTLPGDVSPKDFSIALPVYSDDANADQTIVVGGSFLGRTITPQTVNFSFPAAPVTSDFGLTITSPIDGSTVDSREVTVEGSAFGLSNIIVYAEDGTTVLAETTLPGDVSPKDFSIALPVYSDDANADQTIVVGGSFLGRTITPVNVNFSLPAVAPAPPVAPVTSDFGLTITSPIDGSTVDSREVTVEGSVFGTSNVIVYAADGTTVLANQTVPGDFAPKPFSITLPVFADDANISQRIVVGGSFLGSTITPVNVNFSLPAVASVFAVVTPTEGQQLDSRTVTVTGTGIPTASVNVLNADGSRFAPQTLVASDGTWNATGTFAADADVNQVLRVTQVQGGAGRGDVSINVTLPASVFTLVVDSPADDAVVDSRTVTFTGTGTPGGTVNVLTADGNRFAPVAVVGNDGRWSATGTFAADADVAQTLRVTQVVGGAGRGDFNVAITLPAAAVAVDPTTPDVTVPVVDVTSGNAPVAAAPGSDALALTGLPTTAILSLAGLLTLAGGLVLIGRRKLGLLGS